MKKEIINVNAELHNEHEAEGQQPCISVRIDTNFGNFDAIFFSDGDEIIESETRNDWHDFIDEISKHFTDDEVSSIIKNIYSEINEQVIDSALLLQSRLLQEFDERFSESYELYEYYNFGKHGWRLYPKHEGMLLGSGAFYPSLAAVISELNALA